MKLKLYGIITDGSFITCMIEYEYSHVQYNLKKYISHFAWISRAHKVKKSKAA